MTQPPYPNPNDPYQQGQYSGQYSYGPQSYPQPYSQPYQQPPYPYGAPARPTSSMAVTALVLGILALLFCWIPFIGVIAWPLAFAGGGFGIAALGPTRRGEADGYGLAVAGLVCSGIALLVCVVYLFLFVAAYSGR